VPPLADRLDHVAAALNRITSRSALARAIAVGRTVVEHLYGGDLALWRARGRRPTSLRRLAARADVDLSVLTLHRYVEAYALTAAAGVSSWKHLPLAHIRQLSSAQQSGRVALARQCEAERWSVDRLRSEVKKRTARARPNRGGRPRRPALVNALGRARRALQRAAMEPAAPEAVDEILAGIATLRADLRALEEVLRAGRDEADHVSSTQS
jgi:hypothetical protein